MIANPDIERFQEGITIGAEKERERAILKALKRGKLPLEGIAATSVFP